MVERLTRLILVIGLLVSSYSYAQQPQATTQKIGYVDMKLVLDSAPQVVAGRDAIDREFRPRNNAVQADEQRMLAMQERIGGPLDDITRAQLDRDIRSLKRAIDRRKEDLIEEINFRLSGNALAVRETLELAIREVAQRQGFDLVITDPVVLYHSQQIDLTNAVLKQLRNEYDADRLEQANR